MSNQNQQQNYYRDPAPDYGKRYRKEDINTASYDNYDVEESVPRQRQIPQGGYRNVQPARRRPNPQGYGGGQARPRQPYQQNPQYYPDPRRQVGYGDSYNGYDNRRVDRQRYDDRYNNYSEARRRPVKKKTSGPVIAVRVVAIILLIAGIAIVGMKLYGYYDDNKGHNELKALSADMEALYAKNNDFFGWLKIDDTVVDYPVMYSPGDPELYLHADFDGNYSESGELFMDANCDPNGYHYLIYGHHMFNGSMFGSLPKYDDQEYYSQHRTFRFDTRFEKGEYEIFAIVYSQVYDDNDDVFKYYYYANLNDETTYNTYVANMKALSVIDTGVTPVYGEKIVSLSTCNYHTDDGRFVVCARKIQ